MHVMFVTGEYPPMQGGVGAYTQELARALLALGVKVSILTSVRAADPEAARQRNGLRVLPVVRRWDWGTGGMIDHLRADLEAEWIHVQYQTAAFYMHPGINFAPRYWRRLGRQVAWTYHDLLPPYLFPKAGRRLRTWVTEQPARHASCTVVTNEADRLQLAAKGLCATKIPIGSNIEGVALSPEARAARRALHQYGADDLVLAYFGFLNRSKGGLDLVRVLHRVAQQRPQVRLLMIGERVGASDPTNYAYLLEVESLIRELGLEDRVQWTGRQTEAEVAADLNACDVVLMPYVDGASLRRGTLMAALANGCAIVTTTPQTPLPELHAGQDVIYTPPGDVAVMAAAVEKLGVDAALAATLRRGARQASEQFRWSHIAAEHVRLYSTK